MFNRSQKQYIMLADSVTSVMKFIVIGLLIAIALSQVLLQIPQVRLWVTGVDRLEGTPF
ncbi:hypothetical protein [Paenibacillus sp. R14(2021)]|uniref:hypothetical protein n=1 Tax=Paenibacillus sp. R14(2021) TaxID=2859228 RepID=UPI001C611CA3|nr:hypothetical protein [Paenibacillus sp. R14(2021)]